MPRLPNNGAIFDSIERLGDLDGDGSDELAVGRSNAAQVLIYSEPRLDGVTNFGAACTPAATAGGCTDVSPSARQRSRR